VACICPTADRPEFTAEAIGHFLRQSYPSQYRRLLVYDTGAEPLWPLWPLTSLTQLAHKLLDADSSAVNLIHYQHEPRRPGDTVGAIRNRANALALTLWPGTSLLAHTDSDDWYGPERLSHQISLLISSGKQVVGFSTAKFTDGTNWWRYLGTPAYALGASLVYRVSWWRTHPFPSLQIGEDNIWCRDAWNSHQLLRTDGGSDLEPRYTGQDMLVVRCHAGNTDRKIPRKDWQPLTAAGVPPYH
jgi:hypothetical protein